MEYSCCIYLRSGGIARDAWRNRGIYTRPANFFLFLFYTFCRDERRERCKSLEYNLVQLFLTLRLKRFFSRWIARFNFFPPFQWKYKSKKVLSFLVTLTSRLSALQIYSKLKPRQTVYNRMVVKYDIIMCIKQQS